MNWTKDYQRNYNHRKIKKDTPVLTFLVSFVDSDEKRHLLQCENYSEFYVMGQYEGEYDEDFKEYIEPYHPSRVVVTCLSMMDTTVFCWNESVGRYCLHVDEFDY